MFTFFNRKLTQVEVRNVGKSESHADFRMFTLLLAALVLLWLYAKN